MFAKFALAALMCVTASASAVELFPEIKASHPDYVYYARAAALDQEFVNDHLIDLSWYRYSDDLFFKTIPNSKRVTGRIVQLLDGPNLNPRNLVITNGAALYFVRAELAAIHPRVSMARRWKMNNDEPPGIYLIVRGYRAGALPNEMIPVVIDIRVSDPLGQPLAALEYYEDVGGKFEE
ncbi:MAG: hypothetical protein KF799_13120 [Bdellovibrionales bacterium]|nr:hypothetical protein [Bdellovibrionales bacterium]